MCATCQWGRTQPTVGWVTGVEKAAVPQGPVAAAARLVQEQGRARGLDLGPVRQEL